MFQSPGIVLIPELILRLPDPVQGFESFRRANHDNRSSVCGDLYRNIHLANVQGGSSQTRLRTFFLLFHDRGPDQYIGRRAHDFTPGSGQTRSRSSHCQIYRARTQRHAEVTPFTSLTQLKRPTASYSHYLPRLTSFQNRRAPNRDFLPASSART